METRASHILVGGFVLTFIAGLIAFAVWIAKVDLDAEYADYDIYFNNTVSGLVKRGTVFYLGIPVGEVRDITLAPEDPRKVRVWIRIRAEVPVNEGAKARLEFQGFTGVAHIEISGGSPGAPKLETHIGQERPIIEAEVSGFQALYEGAPDVLEQAQVLLGQIQKILNDDNIAKVSSLLSNVDRLAGNLADGTEDLDVVVATAKETLVAIEGAARSMETLAGSADSLVQEDVKRLVAESVETMESAQAMIARIDGLVAANGDTVTQFLGNSLPEISRMIIDLRSTARSLSRLVGRIEQNPGDVLFGPKEEAYDLKTRTTGEGTN